MKNRPLQIPRDLVSNKNIQALVYKSGEETYAAIGRILLLIDHVSKKGKLHFSHLEIQLIAQWRRTDLMYSEVLEFAGFGLIEENGITLRFPKGFRNSTVQVMGGIARAKMPRDEKGRYLKNESSNGPSKKIVKKTVDAEGNAIATPSVAQQTTKVELLDEGSPSLLPSSPLRPPLPPSSPPLALSPSSPPYNPPSSPLQPTTQPLFPEQQKLSGLLEEPLAVKPEKTASENAKEARRALSLFWRELYKQQFKHEYPLPVNARYNAEIKRIHESLGMEQAKLAMRKYVAWKDPWVTSEGHPLNLLMPKLVKLESDWARFDSKTKQAAVSKGIVNSITKQTQNKTEAEIHVEKLHAERTAQHRTRQSPTGSVQQENRALPNGSKTGVHSKPVAAIGGGSLHAGDGGLHSGTGGAALRSVPVASTSDSNGRGLSREGEVLQATDAQRTNERQNPQDALADDARALHGNHRREQQQDAAKVDRLE